MTGTGLRVVFDLDDTLYPERQFALSGFRAAARWARERWGIDGLAGDMTALLDAGHLGGLFRLALERRRPGASAADLQAFIDVYRFHEPRLTLFDDGADALAWCARLGPVGLITDGHERVQRAKVRALGIEHRFAHIVYTGALGAARAFHKPHPRAFELMEDALGASTTLVYVGDNPAKDFVAPNARGWLSVQVRRDGGIHDGAPTAAGGAPRHAIDSLHELGDLLAAL